MTFTEDIKFNIQRARLPASRQVPRRCSGLCKALAYPMLITLGSFSIAHGQSLETPLTRMRPIGAPSAVEQFFRTPDQARYQAPGSPAVPGPPVVTAQWVSTPREASAPNEGQPSAPHTARMQFQLPAGAGAPTMTPPSDTSMIPPPSLGGAGPAVSGSRPGQTVLGPSTPPLSPTYSPAPTTLPPSFQAAPSSPPRGLPMSSGTIYTPQAMGPGVSSSSDLLPVAPPQLNDQFATIDNCSCISPPSGYVAATGWTQNTPATSYAATQTPSAYIAPTSQVVAPAAVAGPPVIPDASTMPRGSGVPRHSLISFGQDRNPIVVGQGIIGQPVAYVPGQPVRNWIRYLFP